MFNPFDTRAEELVDYIHDKYLPDVYSARFTMSLCEDRPTRELQQITEAVSCIFPHATFSIGEEELPLVWNAPSDYREEIEMSLDSYDNLTVDRVVSELVEMFENQITGE